MAGMQNRNVKTYVYRITNLVNGKDYVGITVNYKSRWQQHIRYGRKLEAHPKEQVISKAIRKYGEENFKFEIISIARTYDIASDLEKLARFLGMGSYNRTEGGEGGTITCPVSLQKISDNTKAVWQRPGHRENIQAKSKEYWSVPENRGQKGREFKAWADNPENKLIRSAITSECWNNPEYREKCITGLNVDRSDLEIEAKRSKGIKDYWSSELNRSKRSEDSKILCKENPDLIEPMKAGSIAAWKDPDKKAKRIESLKASWADPGVKTARLIKAAETRARNKALKAAEKAAQESPLPSAEGNN